MKFGVKSRNSSTTPSGDFLTIKGFQECFGEKSRFIVTLKIDADQRN